MLDAFLASIGGFSSSDVIGNVPNECDVLAAANVSDSDIGVAAKIGLHFDEIGAARN